MVRRSTLPATRDSSATCALIRDRHAPDVAFLPIGDRFTMGPEDAAIAAEWLGVKAIVPMHYGTFPELTGTPDELRTIADREGSKSSSCVREWHVDSGRRP